MARLSKENLKKSGHIAAEITLVIAILCVVALATFGYRLKQGPLDIGFAAPFIQASLSDEARGVATEFDSVALHWPVFFDEFKYKSVNRSNVLVEVVLYVVSMEDKAIIY